MCVVSPRENKQHVPQLLQPNHQTAAYYRARDPADVHVRERGDDGGVRSMSMVNGAGEVLHAEEGHDEVAESE